MIAGRCVDHVRVDGVGPNVEVRGDLALDGCGVAVLFGDRQIRLGLRHESVGLGLLPSGSDLSGLGLVTVFLRLGAQTFGLLIRPTVREECNEGDDDDDNDEKRTASGMPPPAEGAPPPLLLDSATAPRNGGHGKPS